MKQGRNTAVSKFPSSFGTEWSIHIKKNFLLDLTCILWLCNTPVRMVIAKILSLVHQQSHAPLFTAILIYLPLIIYILVNEKIPWKFFHWFVIACLAFFGITYLIHPEYKHWYTRDAFGVYDTIFRPDRGAIWAFLMIEISGNEKRLWNNFKCASVGIFLYNFYLWIQAKRIGYWLFVDARGMETHRTYSLDFGYSMIFVLLVLMFSYTFDKKRWKLLSAILVFLLILDSGSRGSFLCLLVCVMLTLFSGRKTIAKKLRNILIVGASGCIVLLCWNKILLILIKLIRKFNISSRTLIMLVSGEATDDNGRDAIHSIILKQIKEKPLTGYGAFGDRQFIGPRFNWGYSHSILYEMWADFGVILGSIFLFLLLFLAIKIILTEKNEVKSAVIIVILSIGSRLALSNTFWGDPYYWMLVAFITKWLYDRKHKILNPIDLIYKLLMKKVK